MVVKSEKINESRRIETNRANESNESNERTNERTNARTNEHWSSNNTIRLEFPRNGKENMSVVSVILGVEGGSSNKYEFLASDDNWMDTYSSSLSVL